MKIQIKAKQQWEVGQGHRPHRGGSGVHLDKRTKRQRTRAAQKRIALSG